MSVEIKLEAVANTATSPNAYPSSGYPTVGTTNIANLPPVYAEQDFSIQLKVTLATLVPPVVRTITGCSVQNTNVGFNYSISTTSTYAMITITKPTSGSQLDILNSWYPKVWTCLMDDLSIATFSGVSNVTAATNPAYKALTQVSFGSTSPRTETHTFTLSITGASDIQFSISGGVYTSTKLYSTIIQNLAALGD